MTKLNKTIVVTGVSTGIGRAIAEAMIANGWRVFGSVRKQSDAQDAQNSLGPKFTPLIFDVTDAASVNSAAKTVEAELGGAALGGLVNNAGVAIGGPLQYIDLGEVQMQLDINLLGAIRVTQAFLPALGADKNRTGKRGRIVNMSSVAGKIASPILGPYAISKHALEAFSDSLRRELIVHGIDVIIIGPGAVKTPIWDKADEIDAEKYRDTEYYEILTGMRDMYKEVGAAGLEPRAIGDLVHRALTINKPKTRYAILKNKFFLWTLPRLLPVRMVDRAIANRFGIRRAG